MGNKLTFDTPQPFVMRDGSERDLVSVTINNWRVTTSIGLVQCWLNADFIDDQSNAQSPFLPEPYDILDIGIPEAKSFNGVSYDLIPGVHYQTLETAGFTDDNVIVSLQNVGFLGPGTIS